jgi:hypothetical protein
MSTTAPEPSPPRSAVITNLFATQYAVASERQLDTAGVRLHERRVEIERGHWAAVGGGVIALCGAPVSWRQRPMIVTLSSPRGAITAGTALRLHDVDGYSAYEPIRGIAPVSARPRVPHDVLMQRSRRLTDEDLMVIDGIRTTTAAAALVHAAAFDHVDDIGKALDDLLRRGVSPSWVQTTAERWNGRGVEGSRVVTVALAERCDQRLPRSWFERLARRALAEHGIEMEHEVPVLDGRRSIAHLDLANVTLRVGVECQSWAWHATPAARRQNAARRRRLVRLGWDIIELWWSDLHGMDGVVDDVQLAFDRQRRLLGNGRVL